MKHSTRIRHRLIILLLALCALGSSILACNLPGAPEPGDYLLDWKRGGQGLRYCHLVDEAEVERLAAGSGFRARDLSRRWT